MIPVAKPYIGEEEKRAVLDVLDSGWLVQGQYVEDCEKWMCAYTGSQYAACTTSCTTALHLALLAVGVGPEDEVLVPSFTWVASANAVKYCGATPVFVDVRSDTYNIDPELIEEKITKKTKAIMPVHLFGLPCDMDRIMDIAQKYGLKVIEDAACALGSFYKGKHVGTFGDAGCFSFHPRKSATCGEGGMIISNNPDIYAYVRSARDHGAVQSDKFRHDAGIMLLPSFDKLGFNYRMTDIQAAILKCQFERFPEIMKAKHSIVTRYNDAFKQIDWIQIPYESSKVYRYVYQSYVILIKENAPRSRDEIMRSLQEHDVGTRPGTHSVPNLDYYRDDSRKWHSAYLEENTLSLPLYVGLKNEDVDTVVRLIREA